MHSVFCVKESFNIFRHAQVYNRLMGSAMKEVKISLNQERTVFQLELWRYAPNEVIVGRWLAKEGNPYGMAAGSSSWGVWPLHDNASWGAYRIHDADGALLKYRFDALERPRVIVRSDEIEGNKGEASSLDVGNHLGQSMVSAARHAIRLMCDKKYQHTVMEEMHQALKDTTQKVC